MTSNGIIVIGEVVLDIVSDAAGVESAHPGGSPANVAVGLGRLGRETWLISEWADDTAGRLIANHVREAGVAAIVGAGVSSTATARASLKEDGSAEYAFDIAWSLDKSTTEAAGRLPAQHVHTGSLATQLMPGASTVLLAIEQLRESMTVSFDPNARPQLLGDPVTAAARANQIAALSDVIKASDEDLEYLFPGRVADEVVLDWLAGGASLVIVTRGKDGSTVHMAGGSVAVPAVVVTVADTVGAGDSFMSAILDGLASHGFLGTLGALRAGTASLDDVIPLVERASRAAGMTVSGPGANPPSADELDGHLDK